MTVTSGILFALAILAYLLALAWELGEQEPPADYTPRHGRWIQDGETTRLAPPPDASARAGVLQPSEALLISGMGEDEWRLPPTPGAR